ncbi:hypothetical protein [Thermococcus sp. JdF3]|uniref:hypothetical protein n=1 Tax=Thermococcus sp. JdF3 TaxID=1638258 RepID=UPI001438A1D2|nr:hypothetical protein [Thermococcus sp. JdF3]
MRFPLSGVLAVGSITLAVLGILGAGNHDALAASLVFLFSAMGMRVVEYTEESEVRW